MRILRQPLTLILGLFLGSILACSDPQPPAEVSDQRKPTEKLDSIGTWLSNADNYLKNNYHQVFFQYYTPQLKAHNLDSAAHLLMLGLNAAGDNYKFDSLLVQVATSFMQNHERDVAGAYNFKIYYAIGDLYSNNDHFDTSLLYFQRAIPYLDKLTAKKDYWEAHLNTAMAFDYMNLSNLNQAIEATHVALKLFEKIGDVNGQSGCYGTLSSIYYWMENHDEAIKYREKALSILDITKDSTRYFRSSINQLSLYESIHDPRLLEAVAVFIKNFNHWTTSNSEYQLYIKVWTAYKLVHDNKLEEAQAILDSVEAPLKPYENATLYECYVNALSELEGRKGQGTSHKDLYERMVAKKMAEKNFYSVHFYNDILMKDALFRKDYKKAFDYQTAARIARDSTWNKELRANVEALDKKYQTQQKEDKIQIQAGLLAKQQTTIVLLIVVILALGFLAGAYYLWQRQKQLKKEAAIQAEFTQQLIQNTEVERGRIAFDLHDSISHELLSLKRGLKATPTEGVAQKIDAIIDDIRQISRNLHPVLLDKIGLKMSLETLCEQYIERETLFVSHEIDYPQPLPKVAELQLFRIVQEALTNTVKYAQAAASNIHISQNAEGLCLTIQDNGRGFDVPKVLNSGKAFGLHSIVHRANAIGGTAHIQSSPKGTIIKITVPPQ